MTIFSERRDEAIKKCISDRTALINSPGRFRSLDTKREQLLELTKNQVLKQVDREGRVGLSVQRLQEARRDIDTFLRHTQNFNERLLYPGVWMKSLKT